MNKFIIKNKKYRIKSLYDNNLSHHTMQAYFSGTDTSTLRREGSRRNHFVSLIVNNAGQYVAGITRTVSYVKEIEEKYTYKSFDEELVTGTKHYTTETTEILWNSLDITKEETQNSFQELDERLAELHEEKLQREKATKETVSDSLGEYGYSRPFKSSIANKAFNESLEYKTFKEESPTLFASEELNTPVQLPEKLIHSYLLQLITGAVSIADESRIDAKKWASSMEKVFDKRFDGNIKDYQAWAEGFCEFLCMYPVGEYIACDETEYAFVVAVSLDEELAKLPKNKYIDKLREILTLWM